MAECSKCGKQTMSFTCHYCGKKFCSEHRLPENHDCQGLETGKKEEFMHKTEEKEDGKKTSASTIGNESTQKWFKDKDLKEEKRRVGRNRYSLLSDIKYTLKNNLTLSIILATTAFYFLGEIFPFIQYSTMLFPNLVEFSAQADLYPQIIQTLGYEPSLLRQPWSIVTVMITHGSTLHLFANMVTFYFFGSALERSIGAKKLLKFYVGTGITASIGYIIFSNALFLLHGASISGVPTMSPAVGASGAVVATVGAIAMLYPQAEVLLYFVFPMRIQTAVKLFAAIETINFLTKLAGVTLPVIGGFASSAHLAGLAAGIIIGKKLRDKQGRRARINIFQ